MTTIILVAIGILIAAAAAIMTIFYGGESFNGGNTRATAARLVTEGVQIQAAVQLFRAKEDRMPGLDGTGVDDVALWDLACPNKEGERYLPNVPRGVSETPPTFDCSRRPTTQSAVSSPWKVDYNYGIARSVVGQAYVDGRESEAFAICRAARKQIGLTGDPQRCDATGISNQEPCCIMSADDAAS